MYKIPVDFNLDVLKGATINQISFGINLIVIFIEKVGFISIDGSFSFMFENNKTYYEEICPNKSDFGLLNLLEKKIVEIIVSEDRENLTLNFEDNVTLTLIGNKMYETYRLNFNGREIII